MKHIIYGLFDPRTPETIRYVGRSSSGLKRPRQHGAAAKLAADPTYKGNWLRQMLREGVVHGISVLEEVASMGLLNEAEQRWIQHGQEQGWPLTNLVMGGDGSYTEQHADHRQRMAEISRQIWATKKHSPETIAKLRRLRRANRGARRRRRRYARRVIGPRRSRR